MAVSSEPDDILERVQESLQGGPYACRSLEKLSGGSANFVYRGVLEHPLLDETKTVVVKHSEPYVASHKDFKLTTDRCIFEYEITTALQALPPSQHSSITVATPKVFYFSEATKTQVIQDFASSIDLKNYLLSQPLTQSQSSRLGEALGLWTKQFHQWGAAPEQSQYRSTIKGNQAMKNLKFTINYKKLLNKVDEYPTILQGSRSLFEAVVKDAEVTFKEDDSCLCHGDFWTGNILLKNAPFAEAQEEALTLLIVDWELTHLNSIVFELGQMFAELFEVKHFRDIDSGIWIIAAFMQGYRKLDEDEAFKVAIHMGTHLVCWGSSVAGWGSEEQVIKVVEVGRDYIVNGWNKDRTFFQQTPLQCLFV